MRKITMFSTRYQFMALGLMMSGLFAAPALADDCAKASLTKQADGQYVFRLSNQCKQPRRWDVRVCYGDQVALEEKFATEAGMVVETPPFDFKYGGEPRLNYSVCDSFCIPVADSCTPSSQPSERDDLRNDPDLEILEEFFGDADPDDWFGDAPTEPDTPPPSDTPPPVLDVFKSPPTLPAEPEPETRPIVLPALPVEPPKLKPLPLPEATPTPSPTPGLDFSRPPETKKEDENPLYDRLMSLDEDKKDTPSILTPKPTGDGN